MPKKKSTAMSSLARFEAKQKSRREARKRRQAARQKRLDAIREKNRRDLNRARRDNRMKIAEKTGYDIGDYSIPDPNRSYGGKPKIIKGKKKYPKGATLYPKGLLDEILDDDEPLTEADFDYLDSFSTTVGEGGGKSKKKVPKVRKPTKVRSGKKKVGTRRKVRTSKANPKAIKKGRGTVKAPKVRQKETPTEGVWDQYDREAMLRRQRKRMRDEARRKRLEGVRKKQKTKLERLQEKNRADAYRRLHLGEKIKD